MAAHLALVPTSAPKPVPTTDTRLLRVCRQYLALLPHLARLREAHAAAETVAAAVLRDLPADPEAAALWRQCWYTTPASHLSRGVENNERRLAELLDEITSTPAKTEAGLRARLQVWRTVHAADTADLLLDSIMADCRSKRRTRA
jgi:hypothetical protein